MAKDSLARGAKSAQFAGGTPKKDDPIEFHGTVAVEELHDAIESDESWQASEALLQSARRSGLISNLQPLNDRVLIRRTEEEQTSLIAQPDAFKRKPTKGVVLAVGTGMIVGGQLIPIPLEIGDTVYFGEYGPEEVEIEGEKLTLVSAFDIRAKVNAAS